jgi:AcrR family transcriptional regulator
MITIEEINTEKERDLRIKRSRGLIYDALVRLLEDMEYKDITIKDITGEAAVSRPTFYRLYQNKDEILLKYLDEIFEEFFSSILENLRKERNHDVLGRGLFNKWKDNRDFFVALQKADLLFKVMERFVDYSALFQEQIKRKDNKKNTHFHRYLANCCGGEIFMMLYSWFQDGLNPGSSDIGEVLGRFYRFIFEETKYYDER